MKYILIFFLGLWSATHCLSRPGLIESSIRRIPAETFVERTLFMPKPVDPKNELHQFLKTFKLMSIDQPTLTDITHQKYNHLKIPFTINGLSTYLRLKQNDVVTSQTIHTFQDQLGKHPSDISIGACYYGIVEGMPGSIVAISFFEQNIMGIIATDEGNYVIGKSHETDFTQSEYILYNDKDLLIENNIHCGSQDQDMQAPFYHQESEVSTETITSNCVKFYVECDFQIYQDFGSSIGNATNYATALFNNVSTLYLNDSVSTAVSQINVWTVSDPYLSATTTSNALNLFSTQMSNTGFNGDLAHLLSRRSLGGGIAWLDVLCSSDYYKTGVSANLSTTITSLPTYSWNSMVITHECGHNLGSPHTHSCAWNGNNTRIDNCAGNYNINYQSGTCNSFPPDPVGGGTIMSYCHLSAVGINLNLGFGPQPGDLIRYNVNNAACLTTCINCPGGITITGAYNTPLTESSTWIKTSGQTTASANGIVKLDADPGNGYILMAPSTNNDFFLASPSITGSSFIAQVLDGCNAGVPLRPAGGNGVSANEYGLHPSLLYPNPTQDLLHIKNPLMVGESLNIEVRSMDGKIIRQEQENDFKGEIEFSTRSLAPGIYIVVLNYGQEQEIFKVQKQ
ncbi:MAG: T9SS type A sorting domain-containing protein [Chitinophagaceae bacterium]|nr:T9SS type A sorting domain-containing protein [Chitinophagaceae bacterium]